MKLGIKNFAKIKDVDVEIDGITVIAGDNNTGKSTVGKIIFALFNSLSNIEDKILDERLKVIETTSRNILRSHSDLIEGPRALAMRNTVNIARRISLGIRNVFNDKMEITLQEIAMIVENALKMCTYTMSPEVIIEELVNNIDEVFELSEEVIIKEVISSYFNNVFHSQINSLSISEESIATLNLEIKEKKDIFEFANNECLFYQDEINIIHKAVYIDNPFIIDELTKYNELSPMNELLKRLLVGEIKENMLDGIIESVRAKEKLSEIYETLQVIVDGEVMFGQDDEFYLKNNNFTEPISFYNLSTGLKSFVILKMLIEKGSLKDKDVVILDEPEIHLHPQWQIVYAQLIVLLQKHFDLSVIVTTHSPYFMDAINLYSCKYGIDSKVNYYLSSMENNVVKMECVTGNIESIYKKMSSPIQSLESLRYELNNN